MIDLTPDQRQAVEQNSDSPLRVRDPETNATYVLVPEDVYERLRQVLYDGSDWSPEACLQLLADSGKRAGWGDPVMDAYDDSPWTDEEMDALAVEARQSLGADAESSDDEDDEQP